jgi:hypothetical protein
VAIRFEGLNSSCFSAARPAWPLAARAQQPGGADGSGALTLRSVTISAPSVAPVAILSAIMYLLGAMTGGSLFGLLRLPAFFPTVAAVFERRGSVIGDSPSPTECSKPASNIGLANGLRDFFSSYHICNERLFTI